MTFSAHESMIASGLGKYHFVAELARGGMGNVYLVVVHGPGGFSKLLAMKELKPELSDDETYVSMFLEEARLAARLNHANIVQTNEVGSEGRRHYMTMEFLDGRSLHRIKRRFVDQERFSVGAHLRVIAESLLGLHYAHELRGYDGEPLGIVHRDVSPLNVFVTFDGQTKLLDFGIAKTVDSSLETKAGVLKGRIAYMAPEQAGGASADRRADIYSAGVMIWEAVAGRRLWPGMSEVEILSRLLREGPPALGSVCPDAPNELDVICRRAMAAHVEDRYPTAADLHEDLEAHVAQRDDVPSMREIGAIVGRSFADDRRRMSTVIEDALALSPSAPRSGVMPVVSAFQGPTSATLSGAPSAIRESGHGSERPRETLQSLGAHVVLSDKPPASATRILAGMRHRGASLWPRLRLPVGMLCVGAVLGSIVASAIARRRIAPDLSSAERPAVQWPASVTVPAAPELVAVEVRVTPPTAQIAIDGISVADNPFRALYPKDDRIHHIAATADGFEPKGEDVPFSGDVSVDVVLEGPPLLPPRR